MVADAVDVVVTTATTSLEYLQEVVPELLTYVNGVTYTQLLTVALLSLVCGLLVAILLTNHWTG